MKKRNCRSVFIVPVLLAVLMLAACGGSGSNAAPAQESYSGGTSSAKAPAGTSYSSKYDEMDLEDSAPLAMGDVSYEESAEARTDGSGDAAGGTDSEGPQLDEKLVYSGDLTVQTLEYDDCVAQVRAKIKSAGGIIQSESESDADYHWYYDDHVNTSTRTLYLTVRIPSAGFYDFLASVGEAGKVTSRSVSVDNISQAYSDTKTQIEALEIEEKRLLEMMEKAESIEDMIAVESRLTEVQSDLNYYKTRLRGMDTDVAYSTISMTIEEVKKYSPTVVEQSFGDRVREAFANAWRVFVKFLQDVVIIVIELLPFLLLILVIVLLVLLIRKLTAPWREARRKKKEEEYARKQAEAMARRQAAMMQQAGRVPPMPPYGGAWQNTAPAAPGASAAPEAPAASAEPAAPAGSASAEPEEDVSADKTPAD